MACAGRRMPPATTARALPGHIVMKPLSCSLLAGALLIALPAFPQTGTTAPGSATTAASPAPATSAVVNPNRFDPANSHLRRDCFDENAKTFRATRECDAVRMGGGVANSATAPSVGTS